MDTHRTSKDLPFLPGVPGTLILMFRSWQTQRWRNNWDKSQLRRETDIWLKLGLDFIIKEKWIRLSWTDLGKNRWKEEERIEGEDDKVMLFRFSSDLGRKCSQREKDGQHQKRCERGEGWWWDKGTWWGIASINHYRPITLNQTISLFSVLVKRISVITAPCGIAIQSNLINAVVRDLKEHQCWLQLFEEKGPPGIFRAESEGGVKEICKVRNEMRWERLIITKVVDYVSYLAVTVESPVGIQ